MAIGTANTTSASERSIADPSQNVGGVRGGSTRYSRQRPWGDDHGGLGAVWHQAAAVTGVDLQHAAIGKLTKCLAPEDR